MKSNIGIFGKTKKKDKKELLTIKRVPLGNNKEQKILILEKSTNAYVLERERAIIGIIRACSLR